MQIDLNATVTRESLMQDLRRFLAWWGNTLLEVAPERLRTGFSGLASRQCAKIDPEGRVLTQVGDGVWRESKREAGSGLKLDVTLILADRDVLRRTIQLPAAARARLRNAV